MCFRPCAEIRTIYLAENSQQTSAIGSIMIPTLQMSKHQLGEARDFPKVTQLGCART